MDESLVIQITIAEGSSRYVQIFNVVSTNLCMHLVPISKERMVPVIKKTCKTLAAMFLGNTKEFNKSP